MASSQASEWDELPPAESVTLPAPEDIGPDKTDEVPKGHCRQCGEVIVRQPGERGRNRVYHAECRPLKTATSADTVPRKRGAGKAEAEAEACVAALQKKITQAVVMLSVVDRFDAFSVMVALPQISENLKGVLIRYDSLRRDMLQMQTGGSVIGLVFALVMMALPMAAHHGFLGRGHVAKLLVEMPFTLLKIQQRLKEGSEALTKMMEEQLRAAAEANQQREKANADGGT